MEAWVTLECMFPGSPFDPLALDGPPWMEMRA